MMAADRRACGPLLGLVAAAVLVALPRSARAEEPPVRLAPVERSAAASGGRVDPMRAARLSAVSGMARARASSVLSRTLSRFCDVAFANMGPLAFAGALVILLSVPGDPRDALGAGGFF